MDHDLASFIVSEADDFYARIGDDGYLLYDGRWMTRREAIEAWTENETNKFSSALYGALELMADEWQAERDARAARTFSVGQRVRVNGQYGGKIVLDVGDGEYEVETDDGDVWLTNAADMDPEEG